MQPKNYSKFWQVLPAAMLFLLITIFEQDKSWGWECTPEKINAQIEKFAASDAEQKAALDTVAKCGESAVSILEQVILDKNQQKLRIRLNAIFTLGKMGVTAQEAVPELLKIQSDRQNETQASRYSAILALAKIVAADDVNANQRNWAIEGLIQTLGDQDDLLIEAAAEALAKINDPAIPALKNALKNPDYGIQLGAALALGQIDGQVKLAVDSLISQLDSPNIEWQERSFDYLNNVFDLIKQNRIKPDIELPILTDYILATTTSLEAIQNQRIDLEQIKSQPEIDELESKLSDTLKLLENIKYSPRLLWELLAKHPAIWILGLYGLLFSGYGLLLWWRPLWLLAWNDWLKRYGEIAIPIKVLPISVPLRWVVLGGLFHYHPRVLDAWVAQQIDGSAREEFLNQETVKIREIYIPVKLELDQQQIDAASPEKLRHIFAKAQSRLLIWGEGGAGKTSLACQIAKWAMEADSSQRLCPHRMLPVLIQEDLKFEDKSDPLVFIEAIRGRVQDLSDRQDPISKELLEKLLRKQRILVIVDRFSEMSEATQKAICPERADFPVYALIVTSRAETTLSPVSKHTVKILRLGGSDLAQFMEKYLQEKALQKQNKEGKEEVKPNLLDNPKLFFDACGDLSDLLLKFKRQNRSSTALFAKLYMEVLIGFQTGEYENDMPKNIPELMLAYVNKINGQVMEGKLADRALHQDLKKIAWECLKENYRPTAAKIDVALAAIGGDDAADRLAYLENRLYLLKTSNPGKDKISFDLDPLAEYFAGLHLVDFYGSNEELWQEFLAKAKAMPSGTDAIQGLIMAVRDCCLIKQQEAQLPPFLIHELDSAILKLSN
ncbi:MAG TPA: HEAT repeat domain-containing protein [Oscillatoriaceae cyanobacterium M33_DOE_052]|uniref:NACHT domain-containing protein n=1 Tax=Planktothricoides sp. SpSt-374 TaxID=2282167 RepID=A0A7C3VG03_9CYAN|nr:HEAT repeat domain-containing protein [Oscillatoriaceae cyanobacterium M33_DOE_052]